MAEIFALPSGAKFEVQPLSYDGAWAVTQIILKEIEKSDVASLKGLDFKKLMASDILELKGPICHIIASNAVLEAVKQCFKKCLYDNNRIDNMTFETKQARGDFLSAAWFALKENVVPFFASLDSLLKTK